MRKTRRRLRAYLKLGGGTVEGAVSYAHDELDFEFNQLERRDQNGQPSLSPAVVDPAKRPPAYPRRMRPDHPATRQYSRDLNRAIKFKDVAEFSRLLGNPPVGLEVGAWAERICKQLATMGGFSGHESTVNVAMMRAFLDSGLPCMSDLPALALSSLNQPVVALLCEHGMMSPEEPGLAHEAFRQIIDGHWPHPDKWCPTILGGTLDQYRVAQLFPNKYRSDMRAFSVDHLTRIASLPIGESFKKSLSQAYTALSGRDDFDLLENPDHLLALGALIDWGWIDGAVAIKHANPDLSARLEGQMERARRARSHALLEQSTREGRDAQAVKRF